MSNIFVRALVVFALNQTTVGLIFFELLWAVLLICGKRTILVPCGFYQKRLTTELTEKYIKLKMVNG